MFWPFANAWRFRSLFRNGSQSRTAKARRRRGWLFGIGITVEATDRDDGRFQCQLEPLEPKKVLDADFNLVGTTLTITLDDTNQAVTFVPTSAAGNYTFSLSGASTNDFSGTDGGGITGSGTSTLTVQSTATIDNIVVNSNASVTTGTFTFGSAGGGETIDNLSVDVDGAVIVGTNATFSGSASLDIVGGSEVDLGTTGATFTVTSPGGHLNITPDLSATKTPVIQADTIAIGKVDTLSQGISFVGDTTVGQVSQGGVVSVTGNLTITDGLSATSLAVSGDTVIDSAGAISTAATQTYSGNVTLKTTGFLTSGGAVSFGQDVIGNGHDLDIVLSSSGSVALDGSRIAGLDALLVTTFSTAGSVSLTGPITTTGIQQYNVPTISLVGDTTLNATTATFGMDGSVAGNNHNLTVNGNFVTIGFAGLQNLNVTGTTSARGTISTSGDQTYGGAVTLTGTTSLSGATLEHVGFSGGGRDLTLSFSDRVELAGANFTGISDFVSSGAGGVNLSGTLQTIATQTFSGGSISLVGDTTLRTQTGGSAGRIVVASPTIDGAHNLTLTTTGGTPDFFDVQATIGAGTPLASFSVSNANDTYLHNNVTTTGTQTYSPSRSLFLQKNGALHLAASDVGITSLVQGYTFSPDVTIAGNLDLNNQFTTGTGSGQLVNTLTVTGDTDIAGALVYTNQGRPIRATSRSQAVALGRCERAPATLSSTVWSTGVGWLSLSQAHWAPSI